MTIDRTPKPCLHKIARHQHGDRNAYILDRCRCLPCAAANSTYESRRHRQKGYGRPTTALVDAGPVRAHVEALQAAGLGWRRIAEAAGVANGTMTRLLFGKPSQGHGPSQRINPDAARQLLAVPFPDHQQLAGGARVDGTGTRRRLQALVAVGWSQTYLASRLGMAVGNLNKAITAGADKQVTATSAVTVRELYDELWNQPAPAGHGRTRALLTADKRGWLPPLVWDDDTIDDPTARPNRGSALPTAFDEVAVARAMHGDQVHLRPVERAEVVHQLTAAGYSAADIATRIGIDKRSVQRIRDERRRAEDAA